jgi:hypothetical protein
VVYHLALLCAKDLPMHINGDIAPFFRREANSLVLVAVLLRIPFISGQLAEPAQVNTSVFIHRQWNSPECIAVPEPSAQQQRRCHEPVEKIGNPDFAGVRRQGKKQVVIISEFPIPKP